MKEFFYYPLNNNTFEGLLIGFIIHTLELFNKMKIRVFFLKITKKWNREYEPSFKSESANSRIMYLPWLDLLLK